MINNNHILTYKIYKNCELKKMSFDNLDGWTIFINKKLCIRATNLRCLFIEFSYYCLKHSYSFVDMKNKFEKINVCISNFVDKSHNDVIYKKYLFSDQDIQYITEEYERIYNE